MKIINIIINIFVFLLLNTILINSTHFINLLDEEDTINSTVVNPVITELNYGEHYFPLFSTNLYYRIMCKHFQSTQPSPVIIGSSGIVGSFSYDNRSINSITVGLDPLLIPQSCGACCDNYQYTNLRYPKVIIHGPYITIFQCDIPDGTFNIVFNYQSRVGPIQISPNGVMIIYDIRTEKFVRLDSYVGLTIINSNGGPATKCDNSYYNPVVINRYYGDVEQKLILGPSRNPVVLDSIINNSNNTVTFEKTITLMTSYNTISTSSSSDSVSSSVSDSINNVLDVKLSGGVPLVWEGSVHNTLNISHNSINSNIHTSSQFNSLSYSSTTTESNRYTITIPPNSIVSLKKEIITTFRVTKLKLNKITYEGCFVIEGNCLNVSLTNDLQISSAIIKESLIFSDLE